MLVKKIKRVNERPLFACLFSFICFRLWALCKVTLDTSILKPDSLYTGVDFGEAGGSAPSSLTLQGAKYV